MFMKNEVKPENLALEVSIRYLFKTFAIKLSRPIYEMIWGFVPTS